MDKKYIISFEDNEYNIIFLEHILKNKYEHANFIYARDGINYILKNHKNIHLILMDIGLPDMNGNTATEIIKSIYPNIPIITQTAHHDYREKTILSGSDYFLTKPFTPRRLLSIIENLII